MSEAPREESEPERLFRLASEEDAETFLDLETGAVVERAVERDVEVDVSSSVPAFVPDALHSAMVCALRERWHTYLDDAPGASVDLRGEVGIYTIRYMADEDRDLICCCTRSPVFIPKRQRKRAMEFITRANYGTLFGAFEMSVDEGHLYYRTGVLVAGGIVSPEVMRELGAWGARALDRYMPELLAVLFGGKGVEEAVRVAEG